MIQNLTLLDINMPQALTALASTSLIRPIPTASYAGTPKKATSIGPITAASLIPVNPVPMPAPAPARKHMSIFNNSSIESVLHSTIHVW